MIQIFADGSYYPEKKVGGYSAVIIDTEKEGCYSVITGSERFTSSEKMELKAIIEGLKCVTVGSKVIIYTDCQAILDYITGKGKVQEKRTTLKHMIMELKHIALDYNIEWEKVKAHCGENKWHQMADQLAKQTTRERIKNGKN